MGKVSTKTWTTAFNTIGRDKELSVPTLGIAFHMLQKGGSWKFRVHIMMNELNCSENMIRSALKELRQKNYILRKTNVYEGMMRGSYHVLNYELFSN